MNLSKLYARMTLIAFLFALLLSIPILSHGQQGGPVRVNGKHVSITTEATGTLGLQTTSTDDINLATNSTKRWEVDGSTGALLPVATPPNIGSSTYGVGNVYVKSGNALAVVPAVPTLANTPIAGTNDLKYGVNKIPTNAANNAALLPATPVPGGYAFFYNAGANTVRIKAGGASTINGSAAGAYIPIATLQAGWCFNADGTDWVCQIAGAIPTPAGP